MSSEMQDRAERIESDISDACAVAGRDRSSVKLLAVSKTFAPEDVDAAADAGLCVFGESRVQEAFQKMPLCRSGLEWHMIGHLQSNKAALAVRLFSMIHAVDSLKLLKILNRLSAEEGKVIPVCLEVNVSGEGSKFGMNPDDLPEVLSEAVGMMNVDVSGLMTIPPASKDAEDARPYFRKLRELRDRMSSETGFPLQELSMGMSHDFKVAIEEGSTWVRVGSSLFGKRTGGAWKPGSDAV